MSVLPEAEVKPDQAKEPASVQIAQTSTIPRVLVTGIHALPPEFQARTDVLAALKDVWWEAALRKLKLDRLVRALRPWRVAWSLYRAEQEYDVVITDGARTGSTLAVLHRLRGSDRPVHVMYDCYWYHGNWFRRAAMHFCLDRVDLCVVWTNVECRRYAAEYAVSRSKFAFVRHHHTLKRYQFDVGDDGYIFTGGISDRDYRVFCDAVRELPIPCVLATTSPRLLQGLAIPANVRVVSATATEFRQLMARSRLVIIPMRANLLRTGGQQTFLNAMCMKKPVILTDPEGGADYIENGKTGVLVPAAGAAALREAIARIWEHPEEARAMADAGHDAAVPLTTERCNMQIWELSFALVRARQDRNRENLSVHAGGGD